MKHPYFIKLALVALFSVFLLSQCYYDEVLVPEPENQFEDVSFSNDIIPIFNADCNTSGCHNSGGIKPDLSPSAAYNALISGNFLNTTTPVESELYRWMNGDESLPMPPTGPNATYNAQVLQWITEGALNN